MPKDSNETANIDELLAELKSETVEESTPSKKDKKQYTNDDFNQYEMSDTDGPDENW